MCTVFCIHKQSQTQKLQLTEVREKKLLKINTTFMLVSYLCLMRTEMSSTKQFLIYSELLNDSTFSLWYVTERIIPFFL